MDKNHLLKNLLLIISMCATASLCVAVFAAVTVVHANQKNTRLSETGLAMQAGKKEKRAIFSLPVAAPRATPLPFTQEATVKLFSPPLEQLSRIAGDPPVLKDEISVRVPVLMYHQIRPLGKRMTKAERYYSISPESFAAQMESLVRAGYHTITPADLDKALIQGSSVLPEKPVLLTFDDGFQSQYENAFPVLKRLNLQATFFVITYPERSKAHITDEVIKELDQSGLITIAAHTRHHVSLTRYSHTVRENELAGSKKDLEDLLGHPVTVFAYPYGNWRPDIAKQIEKVGYTLAFGVRLGSLHTPSSRYQLRRIRVLEGESVVDLCDRFLKTVGQSKSLLRP